MIIRYGTITITTNQGELNFNINGFCHVWPADNKVDVRLESRGEALRYARDCIRLALLWHDGKRLRLWLATKIFNLMWPQQRQGREGE